MGKLSLENAVKESQEIIEALGGIFDPVTYNGFAKLVAAGRIRSDGSSIYFKLSRSIIFGGQTHEEVKVSDPIRGAVLAANINIKDATSIDGETDLVAVYCGQSKEFITAVPNADVRRLARDIIQVFL